MGIFEVAGIDVCNEDFISGSDGIATQRQTAIGRQGDDLYLCQGITTIDIGKIKVGGL